MTITGYILIPNCIIDYKVKYKYQKGRYDPGSYNFNAPQ